MVQVGDEVTVRNWGGEEILVRVQKLGESKAYGPTIEGKMVEDGVAHKSVAVPATHLVQVALVKNVAHGKWDVTLPGGAVVRVRSKKAAQEFCAERGYSFQEEA